MKTPSAQRWAPLGLVLVTSSLLWGCSALEENKVDYKSAAKAPALDIPPDLTQLRRDSRYAIESNSTSALGFNTARQSTREGNTATNRMGDVRLERQGTQRWLVVGQSADQIWDSLRSFWVANGFVLSTDAPDLGIMETDWAENRAKLPQDFIRRTLGKVVDGLYSTGERDRYRTRVERNAEGGVDIYVTHRGLIEDFADASKTRTVWKPRPSDPELEIEFLRRLMVRLGAAKDDTATSPITRTDAGPVRANLLQRDGAQVRLVLPDDFERSWRRVGVALDRAGFTVEDRDRSKGLYFVRYVPPSAEKEKGFFGRMFSSSAAPATLQRYQVLVSAQASGNSTVSLRDPAGQASTGGEAEKILQLIGDQLR